MQMKEAEIDSETDSGKRDWLQIKIQALMANEKDLMAEKKALMEKEKALIDKEKALIDERILLLQLELRNSENNFIFEIWRPQSAQSQTVESRQSELRLICSFHFRRVSP